MSVNPCVKYSPITMNTVIPKVEIVPNKCTLCVHTFTKIYSDQLFEETAEPFMNIKVYNKFKDLYLQ